MPIPKGTFPARFKGVPLHECLKFHHIQASDKAMVMEEIRKAMVDAGEAEFTVDDCWQVYLDIQCELDEAFLTDQGTYSFLRNQLVENEVVYWAERAALEYQIEVRDDIDEYEDDNWYPDMLDRILSSLERSGRQDAQEWVDFLVARYQTYGADQEAHLKRNRDYFDRMQEAHDSGDLETYRKLLKQYADGEELE